MGVFSRELVSIITLARCSLLSSERSTSEKHSTLTSLRIHRNRDDPIGYKLSVIPFANGEPVEPSNSSQPTVDIMQNPDVGECPDNCFRPVGLAWDSQGRLFMTSDSTGEIYVITRTDGGNSTNGATPTTGLPPAGTSSGGAAASTTASAASRATGSLGAVLLAAAVVTLSS